jgi:peptidyl-prolyl cis-trans isomerase D
MAAIGRIRRNSGLLIAIIGVALAAFVLGDLFKSGGSGRRQNTPVAVVNGEEIPYRDFNRQAEQNLENQRQRSNTGTLSDRERFSVRQQTYEQMVREILMEERYDELGIDVTTEELYELVQGSNPHQVIVNNFRDPNTNQFNPARVREFLANLNQMERAQRQQWINLEQYIKDDRKQQKFNNLITKAYYVPDSLAKMAYLEQGTTADIDYFGVKYQTVEDDEITITEEDYKNFYEENKHRFKNEKEQRNIEYVVFEVQATQEDINVIEKQVNELDEELAEIPLAEVPQFVNAVSDQPYDSSWKSRGELPARLENTMFTSDPGAKVGPYVENDQYHIAQLLETTMRPDSMKASHILIAYQGASRAQDVSRSRAEAQAMADSLQGVLKNNPSQFGALAREHSDGPTGAQGGDLGWFADGAMAYGFNEAVVNSREGDITLAETPFGFHVIEVTGKKKAVKKVRVAHIVRQIQPSGQTYQDVYTEASAFAGENNTYKKFENAIAEEGLNKRTTGFFDKSKFNIPGIDNPRQIVRWAFDEETELKDVSKVFEDEEKFIIAALIDQRKPGYMAMKEVKDQIEPLVRREKKAEIIIDRIEEKTGDFNAMAMALGAEIRHYDNLRFNGQNLKGFGREVEVIAKIFNLEEGSTSSPIQGNMAVYVVKMNTISEPRAITNYQGTKSSMEQRFQRNAARIYQSIKESADVEDNTLVAF